MSRRRALCLAAAAGAATVAPALVKAAPREGELCLIEYRFNGNGPWNYMHERPPEGVTHVRELGYFIGETDRHYLTAHSFSVHEDGSVAPTHCQHWNKTDKTLIISPLRGRLA